MLDQKSLVIIFKAAFLLALFSACGQTTGCAGCEGEQALLEKKHWQEDAVQVRVTEDGLNFFGQNLNTLLSEALPDGNLSACIPAASADALLWDIEICQEANCPEGQIGCPIALEIGDVQLDVAEPAQVIAQVIFDRLRLEFEVKAVGSLTDWNWLECGSVIGGDGFGVTVPLSFDTPDPDRLLTFELGGQPEYNLNELDIDLDGDGGILGWACDITGWILDVDFIRGLILPAIQGAIDDLLLAELDGLLQDFTCRSCMLDAECPRGSGAVCRDGKCTYDDGSCVPIPLGLAGSLELDDLLGGLSPTLSGSVDYMAVPGGYVEAQNQGLSLGMFTGTNAIRNRCVPSVTKPPIVSIPRAELLSDNRNPESEPYHVGIGLAKSAVEQFAWSFFTAGALCIEITSERIEQLNAGILSLVLPSLAKLAGDPQAPVGITMSPQFAPEVRFGTNTFGLDEDGQRILEDPLLVADIDVLWIDFHVFMDDRWVRFMSLKLDLTLPVGIDFSPENEIIPIIGDLTQGISNLAVANAELVGDDTDRLITLLPTLLGTFIGSANETLVDPIQLPDILGFQLDMNDGAFTGTEDGSMLAVFARLMPADEGDAFRSAVETEAEVIATSAPTQAEWVAAGIDAWKLPYVIVDVAAWDSRIDEGPMEVSWRVDEGLWSPFTPVGEIHVRHPSLLLPGRHGIELRARRSDDYTSLDPTPYRVNVLMDGIAPNLDVTQVGDSVHVDASDLVTPRELLTIEVRRDGGPWIPLQTDQFSMGDANLLSIRALDEAGNSSETQVETLVQPLIGRASYADRTAAAQDDGCGCRVQRSRPSLPLLLGCLVFGILGLRRQRLGALFSLLALIFFGCSDDSGATNDGELAMAGTMVTSLCADVLCEDVNATCISGECGFLECGDGTNGCDALECDARCNAYGVCECEPFCGGECGENEFCCLAENICVLPPSDCEQLDCQSGYEARITANADFDYMTCTGGEGTCECVVMPPIETGVIGRYLDLGIHDGQMVVSAYSDDYGDLVVGLGDPETGVFQWMWIDGVSLDGEVMGDPAGPRGGIVEKGVDVGRYTALAVGLDGDLHIAYYDVDNGDLKYAFGSPDGETYAWTILTLDDTGDSGTWNSISLDANGAPGIAYRMSNEAGESQIRFIQSQGPEPTSNARWNEPFILQTLVLPSVAELNDEQDVGMGSDSAGGAQGSAMDDMTDTPEEDDTEPAPNLTGYAEGTGLFTTQARDSEGHPVVAWYDRSQGQLWWSRMEDAGFSAPEMLAGWGHPDSDRDGDMGSNVDLVIDPEGYAHLCYQDGMTDSLRYLSPGLERDEWVDDGVWLDTGGRGYAVHIVGEDCNMLLGRDGQPSIVYQDATLHALLLRHRDRATPEEMDLGWGPRDTLRGDNPRYRASYGFYAKAVIDDSQLWVVHFVYRLNDENEAQGPRDGLDIVKVDL